MHGPAVPARPTMRWRARPTWQKLSGMGIGAIVDLRRPRGAGAAALAAVGRGSPASWSRNHDDDEGPHHESWDGVHGASGT